MSKLVHEVKDVIKEVYEFLGGGYNETVYEEAMSVEFRRRGIDFNIQKNIEIIYKGEKVGLHRIDFVVENVLVVELKAATAITKAATAQIKAYLKTLGMKEGILVNFPYPEKPAPEIVEVKV